MPTGCCGGSSTCACRLTAEADSGILIEGSGTPSDPFILDLEAQFVSAHNQTFDTIHTGEGTAADPWKIETVYSSTARLDHLPDVNVPAPTSGQVLSWNAASAQWVAAAPTVAPTGAVSHDTSLSGDGSPALPLGVTPMTARLFGTFSSGVGLNDQGMLSVVQHFGDDTARTAGLPVPTLNQLSMVDTRPGRVEFWNGSIWAPLNSQVTWLSSDEFMELSGPYIGGPAQLQAVQVDTSTDALGVFDILSPAVLSGRSGVLTVSIQETGSFAWKAMPYPNTDRVSAIAYRISDGSVLASQPVTALVMAITY